MKTTEKTSKLNAALAKAQADVKTATKDSDNPFLQSTYADLASVYGACREALTSNNIAVHQCPETRWSGEADPMAVIVLTTRLAHEDEWIESVLEMRPSKQVKQQGWQYSDDPQSIGSCITYMRRYALASMVGVASEDDDGNAASKVPARTMPAQRSTPANIEQPKTVAFRDVVAQWSAVSPEDIPAACKAVFSRLDLPTDRSKIKASHTAQALKWVNEQIKAGNKFEDAIKKELAHA